MLLMTVSKFKYFFFVKAVTALNVQLKVYNKSFTFIKYSVKIHCKRILLELTLPDIYLYLLRKRNDSTGITEYSRSAHRMCTRVTARNGLQWVATVASASMFLFY